MFGNQNGGGYPLSPNLGRGPCSPNSESLVSPREAGKGWAQAWGHPVTSPRKSYSPPPVTEAPQPGCRSVRAYCSSGGLETSESAHHKRLSFPSPWRVVKKNLALQGLCSPHNIEDLLLTQISHAYFSPHPPPQSPPFYKEPCSTEVRLEILVASVTKAPCSSPIPLCQG